MFGFGHFSIPSNSDDLRLTFRTILILLSTLVVSARLFRKKTLPYPPGPSGVPILGNALQIPPRWTWLWYTEQAKQFGDVVCVTALGQPIVVLSSKEATDDLLVKKTTMAGRPYLAMMQDLIGWRPSLLLSNLGPVVQGQRKLMHQFIGPLVMPDHHSMLEHASYLFAQRTQPKTEGFMEDFVFTITGIVLRTAYGIIVESPEDEMAQLAQENGKNFEEGVDVGNFLVNIFPIMRHIPAWFPAAKFRRTGIKWNERLTLAVDGALDRVKAEMAAGTALPSFTSKALENRPAGTTEDDVKWAAGSLYVAAARTTMASIGTFLLAMIRNPEVQRRAQAELDSVIGSDRLPTLADRSSLPYLEMVLKEVMRWHPAAPLGLPHVATEDCQYKGYHIPKNTIVLGNIWALSRDTTVYESPDLFNPERYEEHPGLPDPRDFVFGFGRRSCPGQSFAEASLWITMATLLSTLNMRGPQDEEGNEVIPEELYAGTVASEPEPFSYRLEPRSSFNLLADATA